MRNKESIINEFKSSKGNDKTPEGSNNNININYIPEDYKKIIEEKNKEIEELKNEINKLKNNKDEDKKIIDESIITINFTPINQQNFCSIHCYSSDVFAKIENKYYEAHPEFRETDNFFVVNGQKIKRFKTIKDNSINDGDTIIMNTC